MTDPARMTDAELAESVADIIKPFNNRTRFDSSIIGAIKLAFLRGYQHPNRLTPNPAHADAAREIIRRHITTAYVGDDDVERGAVDTAALIADVTAALASAARAAEEQAIRDLKKHGWNAAVECLRVIRARSDR